MKIKIGPVEVEQDPIKDELLFPEYKESAKLVDRYLSEKGKVLDFTVKNLIAGKTVKMIRDFVITIVGGIIFTGWCLYVFWVSKDSFVWKEMSLHTVITVVLQALLIFFICFLPAGLVGGGLKTASKIKELSGKKKKKTDDEEE